MRRKKKTPYFFLLVAFFLLLSVPDRSCQKIRFLAISSVAPFWHSCHLFKDKLCVLLGTSSFVSLGSEETLEKMEEMKRENQFLSSQISNLRQWLLSEDRIEEQLLRIKGLDLATKEEAWRGYFQRRRNELSLFLKLRLKAIPAKVIYREPSSWSSFIWLNVGEMQNEALNEKIIAKNSPVVIGNALIGVVEEVGKAKCKVRLITDANLFPAVRAARGAVQDLSLAEKLESLSFLLEQREDLFTTFAEKELFLKQIEKLSFELKKSETSLYLAKGELRGSSLPLWRSRGQVLRGVGFNYDFADEEGEARDLRTGTFITDKQKKEPIALLREGDLLITSGLDGVFPAGLEVATVSKVFLLKEGASSYEIEARPVTDHFDEFDGVFILPPLIPS